MSISLQELQIIIIKSFPEAKIKITDLAGDNNHYMLEIADKSFLGKSLVEQHKMVKQALKEILVTNRLHAITIKTTYE